MLQKTLIYFVAVLVLASSTIGGPLMAQQSPEPSQEGSAEGEIEGGGILLEEWYRMNDIQLFGKDYDVQCGGGNAGDVSLTGENEADSYNFLTGKGMTPQQAAAVIGNFKAESGPNIDPKAENPSGAYGIAQWLGGRRVALNNFANDPATGKGRPVDNLGLQLDYFWHEITNTPEKQAYEALKAGGTNVGELTKLWAQKFERPSAGELAASLQKRIDWAEQALAKYGGGAVSGGAPGVTTGGCAAGGIGTVGNFTFPLMTTKTTLNQGMGGMKWCNANQNNCHHDYNAADIFAPTGTTVIAAVAGEVVSTHPGRAANVVIKSADGHIYYYTHMGPQTTKVQKGAQVTAGQQLGLVGTSADAQGTPPHLHIDLQPPPATGRPACSGAACKAYKFLNVQPPLVSAYQALPQ